MRSTRAESAGSEVEPEASRLRPPDAPLPTGPPHAQPSDTHRAHTSKPDRRTTPADTPLETILDSVRSYWGFDRLRPLQEEAIRATLAGRDSVVVLPTGGGKSLCYQVPPALADRTDIVVSPLISLMKDQVDGLTACGYPAAAVHSGQPKSVNDETLRGLRTGQLRLVFVSPERLLMPWFLDLLQQTNVRSFAIDEAHCISHWGHDFRPEYRRLHVLKQRFPQAGVHAYTATATGRVREDIAAQLGLTDPLMLVGVFDRPNLTYRIVPRFDAHAQVIDAVNRHPREGVIVYCLSRKDTEAMAAALTGAGIDARAYHAGLEANERRNTQDAFASERLNVVAATVAFGMGIDRSNVRCVIHATMPKSIEHYQQETGRAGRDGLEAECVLFYSGADAMRWQSLIARSAAEADDPEAAAAAPTAMVRQMQRYCNVPKCRHSALSEHFGQTYPAKKCEACDVCLDETEGMQDATEVARKILSSVARIEQCSGFGFGVGHTVDVLGGADTEMIRKRGHEGLSTYGILKGTPKKTLTNWVYQLVDQGLLDRTTDSMPVLQLNEASWEVMRGQRTVQFLRAAVKKVKQTRAAAAAWQGVDAGLFEHLRTVRFELAEAAGVPAFVIFSDKTLRDLARLRPSSAETFQRAHGIGQAKQDKFGVRFAAEIASYCQSHDMETDVDVDAPSDSNADASVAPPPRSSPSAAGTSASKQAAFGMFAKGDSIDEVASALSRAHSTVAEYLSVFVEATSPESIEAWVDDATYTAVARVVGELGTDRLKPIFERLKQEVPYDVIRVVVAHLSVRSES